ncbi:MAG: BREX-1 system adenine-specific DNA-methyltransferase PglX [Bacteroidales bacterium]|nr:BREX-1 system adenine-specific DNA-methyltransferase PglX [Bacteroidales bacterium]
MSLFQKSVLNKYLKEQDKTAAHSAYEKYRAYFHNPQIQQNIRESKEEQFQEGFLRELFVDIFGFVLNPQPDFNLTTEFKNEKGAKKADGAVLKEGKAIAVIELKSTKTKDLESIRQQAFDYKANQTGCVYVITSNFQKLRFYINDAVEFEEFDLFILSEERFEVLFLCLNSENLLSDLPLKIKNASLLEEEQITKKFYTDYSLFKKDLFESMVRLNMEIEGVSKLLLYKKTQKLLDRFLFIFFAEDRGLLPPNSISRMIERWTALEELDAYKPLYEIYKQYFGYLNKGRPGKVPADDIHEYNGGLFLPDELLDKIEIEDEVLLKHTSTLTNYDFDSSVDVNILGHIFEHSLNEIESTTAELEGIDFDKQKSKRKKDGVFYTPKYITKYIVDNTVGKLCEEKKTELGIRDDEFTPSRQKATKKKLLAVLEKYRSWLLELTICDPACGSGAFLNQALEFLISEHHYIDELNARLFGSTMVFRDVENQILENNIFGVDINEESVDIARLSLWLRTAQRGRKLTTLNKNIKCGNSLIDDPEVAGDKTFKWEEEFPEVFEKGGFDVVIGNPPYVSNWTLSETNRDMVLWLSKRYKEDLTGHWDLFICFISISLNYMKPGGYNSFILPTSFLKEKYGKLIREKLISKKELVEIIDFGENIIFENVARQTFIYVVRNKINKDNKVNIKFGIDSKGTFVPQQFFKTLKNTTFKTTVKAKDIKLYQELNKGSYKLGELMCINVGVVAHSKSDSPIKFKKDDVIYNSYQDGFKKYIIGSNLSRYSLVFDNQFIDYNSNAEYFHRPKFKLLFENEKIIVRRTSGNNNSIIGYYDNEEYYSNDSMTHLIRWDKHVLDYQKPDKKWHINIDDEINIQYILAIICSKLMTYYFSKFLSTDTLQGAYSSIYPEDLRDLPIKKNNIENQRLFSRKVEQLQSVRRLFNSIGSKFILFIQSRAKFDRISKKLQNWHNLEFGDFIKELNKAIKKSGGEKLSKTDEMEWMEVFEAKKAEAQSLKAEIDQTDKEIDQMVYALYGLTEEEIGIVEGS